jgi:hypothetical protein
MSRDPAASALKRQRLGWRQKAQPACAIGTMFSAGCGGRQQMSRDPAASVSKRRQ